MKILDVATLILGTAIWGLNFVFIKMGLEAFPSFLLCALRFSLTALPLVFFIPKPDVSWRVLSLYAFMTFFLQFSFMFAAIKVGMAPGLTAVVMQLYIFVSIAVAAFIYKERILPAQMIGAIVSFSGIILIGYHAFQQHADVPLLGFFLVIFAAVFTGAGNLIVKSMGKASMFAVVVWSNLLTFLPMILLSYLIEGGDVIIASITNASISGWIGLCYIVFISTFVGFYIWNKQLQNYPAASVIPFGMMIPIFAMVFSALFTGESLQAWKIMAASLVIGGLAINLFGGKIKNIIFPTPTN